MTPLFELVLDMHCSTAFSRQQITCCHVQLLSQQHCSTWFQSAPFHGNLLLHAVQSGSSKSGKGKRAAAAAAAAADAASEDAGSDEEEGSSQEEEPQPKKQQRGRPRKSQHPSRAVLDEASNGSNEKVSRLKSVMCGLCRAARCLPQ